MPRPVPRFTVTVSMQSSSLARRAHRRAIGPAGPGGPSGWALKPESGTMNLNLSPSSAAAAGAEAPESEGRRSDRDWQLERSASGSSTVACRRASELRLKLPSLGDSAGESPVASHSESRSEMPP